MISVTRAPRPAREATTTLTRVGRNERINTSETMPTVAIANVRSLQPKLNSVIEKFENENLDICVLVEIWEKEGKKKTHFELKTEEMLEMKGLKYISTGARPSGVRGGGAAILTNLKKFSVEKVDINVPHNLEVIWAIVRPKLKLPNAKFNEYIICSFYSPPKSRKNKKMLDHLVSCTHALMATYPKAGFYLGGDRNSMPLAPLLNGLPRFKQIVAHNTHGENIIDVLILNCYEFYAVPEISAPVLPDDP